MSDQNKPLTLDDVKACIGFDKDSDFYHSCEGIIDANYKIALLCQNKTEQEAVNYELDKFSDFMLSLSKSRNPQT